MVCCCAQTKSVLIEFEIVDVDFLAFAGFACVLGRRTGVLICSWLIWVVCLLVCYTLLCGGCVRILRIFAWHSLHVSRVGSCGTAYACLGLSGGILLSLPDSICALG